MKKIILAITIMLIVFIAACLGKTSDENDNVYSEEYRVAKDLLVYPNEGTLRFLLLDQKVEKVYIAYIPNETENKHYFASIIELTLKLSLIYKDNFQGERGVDTYKPDEDTSCLVFYSRKVPNVFVEKCFSAIQINSTSEASEIATKETPVILLLGPSQSNETVIDIKEYVVMAKGADFSEVNRTYTDLDLSVAKIILTLAESENE